MNTLRDIPSCALLQRCRKLLRDLHGSICQIAYKLPIRAGEQEDEDDVDEEEEEVSRRHRQPSHLARGDWSSLLHHGVLYPAPSGESLDVRQTWYNAISNQSN